jgi:aminoglycoside phosphotransferase (APT) family kinase protein
MEQSVAALMQQVLPEISNVSIEGFEQIAGGFSRETFKCDARVTRNGGEEVLPLILRKDPPDVEAILHTDRAVEHNLIESLRLRTTIPVSRSYGYEMDPAPFGHPAMLIERASGSGQTSALFNGGADEDQAESVIKHLCEVLVELHSCSIDKIDPDGALTDPFHRGIDIKSWDAFMDSTIEFFESSYTSLNYDPMLMIALDAVYTLRRNKPRPMPLAIVHGDFNPANFLYENGQVSALIDWEASRVGDPREDLGWMVLMDVVSDAHVMDYPKKEGGFLAYYNKLTGNDITPEELGYFTLFGTMQIAVPVQQFVARRVHKEYMLLLPYYVAQSSIPAFPLMSKLMGYEGVPA